MKVSLNNQTPERPEKPDNREERRQKACALRTFKAAKNSSPVIAKTLFEEQVSEPRCLSIQIDTFLAVIEMECSGIQTELGSQIISGDDSAMASDRIERCRYSAEHSIDRMRQATNVNQRSRYRNSVKERRNA